MDKAMVLLSGGMDSATLLHYVMRRLAVPEVYAISFLYGQKHSRELEAARWQASAAGVREHQVVDISFFGALAGNLSSLTDPTLQILPLSDLPLPDRQQPPTYVPNRNMILLSLTAACSEAKGVRDVFYGAQTQDRYGYWDCTVEFLDRINALLAVNRKGAVTVHAPFIGMRKAEEIKLGLELGVDYAHTWTCYRGGELPCGKCPSCEERATAFLEAGVPDPLAWPASAGRG